MLQPDEIAKNHDAYLKRYLTTGVKRVIGGGRHLTAKRRDGTFFPMYLSLGEVKQDGLHTFTGIVRDLTDEVEQKRRITEDETKREEHLRTMIDELNKYRDQADNLISNVLPPTVAEALLDGEHVEPQSYDSSSVMFCDIVGFSDLTNKSSAYQIVELLNLIYTGIAANILICLKYNIQTNYFIHIIRT
jgi:hypothetical protein